MIFVLLSLLNVLLNDLSDLYFVYEEIFKFFFQFFVVHVLLESDKNLEEPSKRADDL